MNKNILYLLLLSVLISCNNQRRSFPTVFNPDALPTQVFEIDVNKDNEVKTNTGLAFNIPKGAIRLKDGSIAKVAIKDATQTSDMLKAGLVTRANGKPLSSGGMFNFDIENEGASIEKPIEVNLPTDVKKEGMEVFQGKLDEDGNLRKQPVLNPDLNTYSINKLATLICERRSKFEGKSIQDIYINHNYKTNYIKANYKEAIKTLMERKQVVLLDKKGKKTVRVTYTAIVKFQ